MFFILIENSAEFSTMSAVPNTLYISECNRDINERDLYCVFANARVEVTRIRLFRDPVTRKSLGRGYIYFSSQALGQFQSLFLFTH